MKKLIVFDLDGTLAESKSSVDSEMSELLCELLAIVKVAVISGGDWPQFEKQLLSNLPCNERLANLSLLPTCGTKFFQYTRDWKKIYSEDLTAEEKTKIVGSLRQAVGVAGLKVEKVWGEVIEDRGSQITFSALGQQAPLEEKNKWDSDFAKRKKIKAVLDTFIPEFSVRLGGATSIDVTKPGIDKAYGIGKLRDLLRISLKEMIFIGDALFVGGNDFPVKEAGVVSIAVRGPNQTKPVAAAILACLDQGQLAGPYRQHPFGPAHASAPNRDPTPAVSAMASAPQNVKRIAPNPTAAPPARAASSPKRARDASEVPEMRGP